MKINKATKSNLQTLGIILAICLFFYILFEIRLLIVFAFIAGVITLISRPLVLFFRNKLKLGNTFSSILTLMATTTFLSFMAYLFIPIIIEQGKNISEIDFDIVKTDLNELNVQASDYLGLEKINFLEIIKATDFVKNFNSEFILSFLDVVFNNIPNAVIGIFAVLFITFFLLKDDKLISRSVTVFADEGKERRFLLVLHKSRILLTRYFVGITLQTLIIAILYFILLYSLGIKNALAIAMVCAFLNVVPYLGPLIGGLAICLIVVSFNLASDFSSELLPQLITVLIGVSIIQLIDNLISQPIIFGQSVKSHPLEIFLVIFIGGLLTGILGMILAVPVYTTLKVISKEFFAEYKLVQQLTKNI